jgi:[Skp1-protein]-hydroxyproline N-acetylglucosaminyltransferase
MGLKEKKAPKKSSTSSSSSIDMKNSLIHHPIFLCLSCLIGFCLVVTIVLVPLPEQEDAGYLKDMIGKAELSLMGRLKSEKDTGGSGRQLPKQNNEESPHVGGLLKPALSLSSSSSSTGDGIPYLPPFAPIPNAEKLKQETLQGKPSIAGVASLLNDFLDALHAANKHNSEIQADLPELIQSYFELAAEYLAPFEAVYNGKPIFPVREDDSIFISLAAFREHLLGQTLRSAFQQAEYPDRIHVGVVVQNCFGLDGYQCRTGMQVYGKNEKTGKDMAKISDAPPDPNGIEEFCTDPDFKHHCENNQVRVIYQHETDALGPAVARYYASKLWAGESYFMQMDAHLEFAPHWDTFYIDEVKAAKNFPKAVLSTYPPGFQQFGEYKGGTKGHRLCFCEFSTNMVERHIIRINTNGAYVGGEPRPTQIAFIAAGFFFARAEFLTDVPFDPYLPWCFMGEEIALSMRAWTAGWDIYAPRTNMIAHQYRPGK